MKNSLLVVVFLILAGCGSSGGEGNPGSANVACASTANDSVQTAGSWIRINSAFEGNSTYHLVNLTRQTLGVSGPGLTMDYMVHEPPGGMPAALIVLIAGGQLTAGITGVDGNPPSSAGGNYLVRSAHLFAAQGYRVLTIDQPSDAIDYIGSNTSGWALDEYRVSMAHAVDLSQVINEVNAVDNLPVVIVGTSRGSISAVAQHKLGFLLALSAPLTSGANGRPIGASSVVSPANVSEPVHVSWHVLDGCSVTTPANAQSLVGDLPDAVGVSISGGFASASSVRECDADHYHGFPGIESCAVQQATDWVATRLAALPVTRPVAYAQSSSTNMSTPLDIDLTNFATASNGGTLTYSLPHASTSLGGAVSIIGNTVSYNPPLGVSAVNDTFVYVVSETGGGTSHNVVSITIN